MEVTTKDILKILSPEQKEQLAMIQKSKAVHIQQQKENYELMRYSVFWFFCKLILYFLLPCFVVFLIGSRTSKNYAPFVLGALGAIAVCMFLALWALVSPY